MFRFSFRFFAFIIILFVGIFVGITVAEKGIYKVAGTPNQGVQSFQVSKNDNQVEVKVLGKTYTKPVPGLQNKKETDKKEPTTENAPPSPSGSYMSKIGNAIGSTLQTGAEKSFQMISNMID